jgi:hypothetical protein
MKNKVMSYKEFMAISKDVNKAHKANIVNKDAKGSSKINQDMSSDPIKGKGTSQLDKFTKKYMDTVKKKSIVK